MSNEPRPDDLDDDGTEMLSDSMSKLLSSMMVLLANATTITSNLQAAYLLHQQNVRLGEEEIGTFELPVPILQITDAAIHEMAHGLKEAQSAIESVKREMVQAIAFKNVKWPKVVEWLNGTRGYNIMNPSHFTDLGFDKDFVTAGNKIHISGDGKHAIYDEDQEAVAELEGVWELEFLHVLAAAMGLSKALTDADMLGGRGFKWDSLKAAALKKIKANGWISEADDGDESTA